MKLQVLQENFSKALSNTSRFASVKAQLPVLGNILFSTKKTKLILSATNLETAISVSVGAKIEKEGEITIPGKIITEIVSNLPGGPIEIETDKEQVKIKTSGFESQVLGMNSSDFPPIPQNTGPKAISFPKDSFSQALSQVVFAASVDETRPVLTGVLFLFEKDFLGLVATDGFRLSQKKVSIKLPTKTQQIILPKGVLLEIARLQEEGDEILFEFKEKENQVVFGIEETILSSRTMEGEFPDFQKIIPKESSVKIGTDKDELLRAVKLASVFARDSANVIKLEVKKDSLGVLAESQSSGSQKTKIQAKVEGEGLEIAFNYRFLEEFLHAVKGEDVEIKLSNPSSPGVFLDPKDTDFLHLIMPVRIQD